MNAVPLRQIWAKVEMLIAKLWLGDDSDPRGSEMSTIARWSEAIMISCCSGGPSTMANVYHRHEKLYNLYIIPHKRFFNAGYIPLLSSLCLSRIATKHRI